MNKVISFFVVILFVLLLDLFHFEAPPNASQDISGSIVAESLAALNDDDAYSNFEPGFKPVTMFLLGSGLIGLAGLGRKKILK